MTVSLLATQAGLLVASAFDARCGSFFRQAFVFIKLHKIIVFLFFCDTLRNC